ncbi:hypothetical protein ScPMuIL_016238 [Solemya velum]
MAESRYCRRTNSPQSTWEKCSNGTYQIEPGTCQECPIGTYQPLESQTNCIMCPPPTTTRNIGSTSEQECIGECTKGTYQTELGTCQECPIGTYQPLASQTSCSMCPPNTTTHKNGATSEQECMAKSPSPKEETLSTDMIIGIACGLGGVIVAVTIIVVICRLRRRRKPDDNSMKGSDNKPPANEPPDAGHIDPTLSSDYDELGNVEHPYNVPERVNPYNKLENVGDPHLYTAMAHRYENGERTNSNADDRRLKPQKDTAARDGTYLKPFKHNVARDGTYLKPTNRKAGDDDYINAA